MFAPNPKDKEPLWGVFGTVESLSHSSKVDDFHKYTIDWNAERIEWGVDGSVVRTLKEGLSRLIL
jgi:Glycosyl hydrolases family 16